MQLHLFITFISKNHLIILIVPWWWQRQKVDIKQFFFFLNFFVAYFYLMKFFKISFYCIFFWQFQTHVWRHKTKPCHQIIWFFWHIFQHCPHPICSMTRMKLIKRRLRVQKRVWHLRYTHICQPYFNFEFFFSHSRLDLFLNKVKVM